MAIPTLKKITGNVLKRWAEYLKENAEGCCSWYLATDTEGNDWYILMGFADGYDDTPDAGPWQIGTWAINTMVGYQSENSALQCDLTVDFAQPYNPQTGEVDDTLSTLPDSPDWEGLARQLNESAQRILTEYASFDDVE
jgi:hypothetical protein